MGGGLLQHGRGDRRLVSGWLGLLGAWGVGRGGFGRSTIERAKSRGVFHDQSRTISEKRLGMWEGPFEGKLGRG